MGPPGPQELGTSARRLSSRQLESPLKPSWRRSSASGCNVGGRCDPPSAAHRAHHWWRETRTFAGDEQVPKEADNFLASLGSKRRIDSELGGAVVSKRAKASWLSAKPNLEPRPLPR